MIVRDLLLHKKRWLLELKSRKSEVFLRLLMCARGLKQWFQDDGYEIPWGDGYSSQVAIGANTLASVPAGTAVFYLKHNVIFPCFGDNNIHISIN